MKSSPFPGMDSFLEDHPRWEVFHGWFIRELARQNTPPARELGCEIDVERSVYGREPTGELYKQQHLVVRESGEYARVLAVVELLSPANKHGSYVPKYREKRWQLLTSMIHFMEIDFLRGGENPSQDLFPKLPPAPYFIFVARKTDRGRNEEGYPLALQDRLPVVGLPLGPGRPDLPLDLASAFRSAYDLSHRPTWPRLYQEGQVPDPPLDEHDRQWVAQILNAHRHD
jgi:hypothetical protein